MKLRSLILASSLAALAGGLQVANAQSQPPTPSYQGSGPAGAATSPGISRGGTAAPKASARQSSDTIRKAQEALEAKGHDVGTPNGVMGPKTRTALLEYQKQQNIPQTGRLDQATLAALGVSGSSTPGASGGSGRSKGPGASGGSSTPGGSSAPQRSPNGG